MAWKIFAYSAFWDDRMDLSEGFRVIIVAAGPRRPLILQRVSCMLNYGDYNQTTDTNFQVINENHGKSTSAILFYCFPASSERIPVSATLFLKKRKIVRAWIPVHQQKLRTDDSTNKTVVCLRPMFGNVILTPQVVEFIAFYQIIGATHFTFYDNGITKEIHLLLKKLQEKAGVSVSIHSWDLPKTLSSIWERGQLAAIQDCIHRHMNTFEFVILVDIDEFIVPQKQHQMTVQEIIHYVDKHKKEPPGFKWGSYVFRNSFFCLEFPSQNSALKPRIELLTQTKLFRKKKIWPPFERSKVIVRPRVVKVGGIHSVIEHVAGYRFQVIPPEFGLLHHYRG
ncbi:beta-1,4-galactosyltransferase galt-1-like, partial [Limulus polyphemus]|uniref:Glycosyltransferase family 92 protein n=1 Tax=Limulus polyphemus TaxID=6850 RepID=A0ABM1C0G9_LIMPO